MTKLTILTYISNYLPGYKAGGALRTLANMVDQLGDEFDFRLVTSDRDLGDVGPYDDVKVDRWTRCGKASVFYQTPGAAGSRALHSSLQGLHIDLVYLNSLFCSTHTLRPLIQRRFGRLAPVPVLLATRGELSPGALQLKAFKKRAFLTVAKATGLYDKVIFQASSQHEESDVRREFGDVKISVASDVPSRGEPLLDVIPQDDADTALRAVFLSRITPKKNLLGALKMLKDVRVPLIYDIYGVIEDETFWAECQAVIQTLPPHVRARFQGSLRPEEVNGVLAQYDFFFFPTHGENYGHVIREALAAGLPILISDQTPWRDLAAQNVGADLPLEAPKEFVAWIEAFAQLDAVQRQAMRTAAHVRGNDSQKAASDIDANRNMLYAAARNETFPSELTTSQTANLSYFPLG